MPKNKKKAIKESKQLKEGYLGQTLQDFLDVCIDEYIIDKIYVYGTDDIVYEGPMDDLPDDMRDAEFLEFEAYSNGRDMVTINVDSTEEYGLDTYYTTLEDFLDDCNNENIIIFDLGSEEEIFRGDKYDIPDEVKDLIFVSFDSPNELSVNLSDYEGDSDDYDEDEDEEEFDEALGKVQEVTKAVDCDGNEFHVKPIWKTDRLATLVDKDGKQTKVEIADLRQTYDLYDQDGEVISRYEDYLDESLDDTQNLIDNAKKFAKENNKDVKVKGLVNSNECVIDTFPEDFNEMVELFNTKFDVYDKDNEFERFKIRVKSTNENLEESSIPVKDLLIKTDNKYGITLDHAIDDIKRSKGYNDSLLGDNYTIDLLMRRFGLEHRDVIRALNYKFDGKVLDESVEDDMEKLPHVVMAFKDGGVHRLELEWRPSTRKAHSDYIDLSQAIKNKFGDADIKVKKQEWRDGNKETRYVLEVTLKDNDIKEDVNQLAKKMGAKLLPPKGYGVKPKRPRYVYEVYYFDTEDCRGDAIYRKFSSRKAQEDWYEKHKDDPDKFGMYAFDEATVYESLDEAKKYKTELVFADLSSNKPEDIEPFLMDDKKTIQLEYGSKFEWLDRKNTTDMLFYTEVVPSDDASTVEKRVKRALQANKLKGKVYSSMAYVNGNKELVEAYNTEDRIKELKEIKKTRALTDDELEELAYCENEVSSREAEKNYLNGESLDENWVKHYRGFDYYEDENEPKYIIVKRVDGKVVDKFVIDATTSQEVKDYIDTNLIKKGAKKKITEAPDELGFLTDDEIEEQERQEFEKKLAQRKADRDKAKNEVQAKEKAKQDAIAKGKELYNKVKDLPLDEWGEHLVPDSGKASTVAGEIIRAFDRIKYREFNDGDLFYQGYGRETCGAPAVYLMYNIEDTYPILNSLVGLEDERYTDGLEELGEVVRKYLLDNPELFGQDNEDDCLDKKKYDVDVEFEEPREYDFNVWANDYSDDYGTSIADYINAGHVDAWEFQAKVKDVVESILNNSNFSMGLPWSHYSDEITIEELTKEEYDKLCDEFRDGTLFNDWLAELYDEFGDPNHLQRDEEVEESVNKNWDTIDFNYEKLPITKLNQDTLERTPMEIDYVHRVNQEDVEDALFNILEDKGELDDFSLECGMAYVMNNFDELVAKYEDELRELFRGSAITNAENGDLNEDLETFDDQMDFLSKDEEEAIDGYKKVIKKVDNDNVKTQLKKIETEEKAHKDYLTKVKQNKDIEYTEPLEEDTIKQGNKWVNKGNTGETHGEFKTKKEADKQRKAMFAGRKPNAKWGK